MNSTDILKSRNALTQWRTHLVFLPILLIGFVACYHDVLVWMYDRYISPESYYSHGFIIPFISGYLIWQKRDELSKESAKLSWWGFFLIIISVLIHIAGTALYVYSVSGFSILLFIFGTTLFIFGKYNTKIIIFPLLFLLFMFPIPVSFIEAISFPLKMFVANVSVETVSNLGIPIHREGFSISIPAGALLVGNPCSGLRSLIAFLALSSVIAHLTKTSNLKKWIIFLSAIPIAVLSNIVRVAILILISHLWGLPAAAPESFWHNASGVLVFAIGFILLLYVGKIPKWTR